MNTIISTTGYAQGYGSARYKQVNGLTREEREAIRNDIATVLIVNCPPSGGGNRRGTTARVVRCDNYNNRFYHRVPTPEELVAAGMDPNVF